MLVRYCDDFVVMCRTAKDCELAETPILSRLLVAPHQPQRLRGGALPIGSLAAAAVLAGINGSSGDRI
jgi:hypothetical protein